jgi:site-specific DNA recombinase
MKAAIYCRLSKEDEDKIGESESIQNQKSMLLQYAIEKGFDIYQIYSDEDYSGIDRNRPAFNSMLQAASEHQFDVVLAKTQSRFTRDMELVEKYLHGKFMEWGIRFIAVVDHVDTNDTANKKSRQINGLINEWYLEDLSTNVRSVLDHKRKEGLFIGSFALYGYCKDPEAKGKLVVDPEAAEIVKRIFSMALSGIGAHKIARILNDEKVPSPTAYKQMNGIHYHIAAKKRNVGLWSSPTVYQMLHNQTYAGNLVQGRHKKISYKTEKTMWLPKSQWIVVENTHEPIIDMETFETVQMMLKERTRSGAKGEIHPLAKKIVCGCCGSFMEQTGADGTQRRYVRCRMHQRAPEVCGNKTCTEMDALENAVLERIRAYAADYFDPEKVTLPEQDDPIQQREQARRDELKRLKSEADRRRKAMQELYLDKVSGLIDAVQFSEMNQTFLQEVKKAETRIDTLEAELKQQQEESGVIKTQMQRVRELAQVSQLTRELVVLLVHRVIVSPKDPLTGEQKITIEWNF